MTDAELTRAAVDALAAGNQSAFARLFGHASPAAVSDRVRGVRRLPEVERRLYRVALAHPATLAQWLREARDAGDA